VKPSQPPAAAGYGPIRTPAADLQRDIPAAWEWDAARRLHIDAQGATSITAELARDVRRGLLAPQKTLPPKYFYDDRGGHLFEAICELPEYYLTRTEEALLARATPEITALADPTDVVEFGSGASRKTRMLLDALASSGRPLRYIPMDISEAMLRQAAASLLARYPLLAVHAVVGDYDHDLHRIPPGRRRLVLFLGSTIGNLTRAATARFVATVRRLLAAGDYFLLGVDLVKPVAVLEAAYNDRAGVTAAFNRNVLRVINGHLEADFRPDRFAHVAFFNREASQIEMHLRAGAAHRVVIRKLDLTVSFAAGETIHTEISRKFTLPEVQSMLAGAGFTLVRWYTPPNGYFGLALARAV
jgi:L-histidine N-alpha-methyltransferase